MLHASQFVCYGALAPRPNAVVELREAIPLAQAGMMTCAASSRIEMYRYGTYDRK